MILAFELTYSGTTHAPGNAAALQTIAMAFPTEKIRVFSDDSHRRELQKDKSLTCHRNITFCSIPTYTLYWDKPGLVSFRRFAREFWVILRALLTSPREHCLIVLLSSTSTAIFAASYLARLFSFRPIAVQVMLHGNLSDIRSPRSRNPFRRAFDLVASLTSNRVHCSRFLVLEEPIKDELRRLLPAADSRVDALPLPSNFDEMNSVTAQSPTEPVKIGFVGLATNAKGIDIFLRVAEASKRKYGPRIEFHHVGKIPPGASSTAFSVLDSYGSTSQLPRNEFVCRLSKMHYFLLPFREGYYDLSASGAVLDAITWKKPLITTRRPLVEAFFDEFGDIGFLCDDEDQLYQAVDAVMELHNERYMKQVEALSQAALSRTPARLMERYQRLVAIGYPSYFSRTKPNTARAPKLVRSQTDLNLPHD